MHFENVSSFSHIADQYNGYPGETIKFSTCIEVFDAAGLTLQIFLPKGLELNDYQVPGGEKSPGIFVQDLADGTYLNWRFPADLEAGRYEFILSAGLNTSDRDEFMTSEAVLTDSENNRLASESVRIFNKHQGNYLDYLPELYRKDELMSRFLMLFESFWKPIEGQIRQISWYFDPDLTPKKMLPWLASWIGAFWDEYLPEDRQRQLLRAAVSHYQRRGTGQALKEFLELYTAGEVMITEHPARNFVLGEGAKLGPKVALGLKNSPHSFSVDVKVSREEFILPEDMDTAMVEGIFRQKLEKIINMQKPAHTIHQLNLEIVDTL